MMPRDELLVDDARSLLTALQWLSSAESAHFALTMPDAFQELEIWAEVRQAYASRASEERKHESTLVVCRRNKRTQEKMERVLFTGRGDCPVCTLNDLISNVKRAIPQAFEKAQEKYAGMEEEFFKEPAGKMEVPIEVQQLKIGDTAYPVGVFGHYVTGKS